MALQKRSHDLAVVPVAPQSASDIRVPTAEEFALDGLIQLINQRDSRKLHWERLPTFTLETDPRTLSVDGLVRVPIAPVAIALSGALTIPALANTISTRNEEEVLSLVALVSEVGQEQDATLGEFSFSYRDKASGAIQLATKENARRFRFFWVLVYSTEEFSPTEFLSNIPTEEKLCPVPVNSENLEQVEFLRLAIPDAETSVLSDGFAMGNYQVYALDPNLKQGTSYTIVPDLVDVVKVAKVRRVQNYPETGYIWGDNGEDAIAPDYAIAITAIQPTENIEELAHQRLHKLMQGVVGTGGAYRRAVLNLLAGTVAGNSARPGESAASPNGSFALANDQRASFTNEKHVSKRTIQITTGANDGEGNALITAVLNSNAPLGTTFSERDKDHQVWSADGVDQSTLGTFKNLGNSLQWQAGTNATVQPGSTIYFSPGVEFPAGSGFSYPFVEIEGAWVTIGGALQSISLDNVRDGATQDIEQYESPSNGEKYIVIYGRERSAIHYIYKKISVVSSVEGVAIVPPSERGTFAFIQGVTHPTTFQHRLDVPVISGLNPETTYQALIYHPPRSTEQWQLQVKYPKYEGLGQNAIAILDGAEIISDPILYCHTQGGGTSVYQGEGSLRYSPIAMHLPDTGEQTVPGYTLNHPIHPFGMAYDGPDTIRKMDLVAANQLVLPVVGLTLSTEVHSESYLRSMAVALTDADGVRLGFRTPRMANNNYLYQSVLAIPIQSGDRRYLIIVTFNGPGGTNLPLDTRSDCSIDLFEL